MVPDLDGSFAVVSAEPILSEPSCVRRMCVPLDRFYLPAKLTSELYAGNTTKLGEKKKTSGLSPDELARRNRLLWYKHAVMERVRVAWVSSSNRTGLLSVKGLVLTKSLLSLLTPNAISFGLAPNQPALGGRGGDDGTERGGLLGSVPRPLVPSLRRVDSPVVLAWSRLGGGVGGSGGGGGESSATSEMRGRSGALLLSPTSVLASTPVEFGDDDNFDAAGGEGPTAMSMASGGHTAGAGSLVVAAAAFEMVPISVMVANNTGAVADLSLDALVFQARGDGRTLVSSLGDKVAWNGALTALLPSLAAGEATAHTVQLMFLTAGSFEVVFRTENLATRAVDWSSWSLTVDVSASAD